MCLMKVIERKRERRKKNRQMAKSSRVWVWGGLAGHILSMTVKLS